MFGIARQIQHYFIRREGKDGDIGREDIEMEEGGGYIVREGRRSACNNTPKGGRSVLLHPPVRKTAEQQFAVGCSVTAVSRAGGYRLLKLGSNRPCFGDHIGLEAAVSFWS